MSVQLKERLKSQFSINCQLLWFLFIARIYDPSRDQYEKIHGGPTDAGERNEWRWRHYPQLPWLARAYNFVSTCAHCYIVVKFVAPSLLPDLLEPLLARLHLQPLVPSARCLVLGRFIVTSNTVDDTIACLFASYHLAWRLLMWTLHRPYLIDFALYLMQPRADLALFIQSINAHAGGGRHHSIEGRRSTPDKPLSNHEQFLCRISCFRIILPSIDNNNNNNNNRKGQRPPMLVGSYKLRPNRTLESRSRLVDLLSSSVLYSAAFVLLAAGLFAVYFLYVVGNDLRYLRAYPGCDPSGRTLDEELWKTDGRQEWRSTLTWHHLVSGLFDMGESGIIWLDSGLVVVYLCIFALLINYDLIIYWSALHQRLGAALAKAKSLHLYKHRLALGHRNCYIWQDLSGRCPMALGSAAAAAATEAEIYELQAELHDFFHQIKQADLLISDVGSFALIVWLGVFGVFNFVSVDYYYPSTSSSSTDNIHAIPSQDGSDFVTFLFWLGLITFVCMAVTTFGVITLQKYCSRSYVLICSLMAYDGGAYKRNFMRILDFYTSQNRTCYTFFQSYPMSTQIYLSVVGWSISCFLVLDSIFRN